MERGGNGPSSVALTSVYRLAKALHDNKEYARAIDAWNAAATFIPDSHPERKEILDQIKVLVGKCLYQMGQDAAAFELFTSVLRENENQSDALLGYATVLLDKGRANVRATWLSLTSCERLTD
mgnify:CR=1 FL=1